MRKDTNLFVALAILFLTRLLYYTPYACLGAIVITAAVHRTLAVTWDIAGADLTFK